MSEADLDRNKTGSFLSVVKSNTMAGVTDDTIYGH